MNGYRYELRNLGYVTEQRPDHIVLAHSAAGGPRLISVREWGLWLAERGWHDLALRDIDRQFGIEDGPGVAHFITAEAVFSIADASGWQRLRDTLARD